MEIKDIDSFLSYFSSIRGRTLRTIKEIPADRIDWRPNSTAFSFADIIRHIAAIEYHMFAQNVQGKHTTYPGHDESLASGYEDVLDYFNSRHERALQVFQSLDADDLEEKCVTPAGVEITVWKWLRAMIEHEIHHRGQIYTYLRLIESESTPLYGLTSEEVLSRSRVSKN